MYPRIISLSKTNSFFLFGARGTGKSYILSKIFSEETSLYIDLLDPELVNELSSYPNNLLSLIEITNNTKKLDWIIIDEVQKVPALLEIVHKLIFEKKFKFALTGSSARKLKRGSANLLAGRAFIFNLFPLTYQELNDDFNLLDVLSFGSLPEIYKFTNTLDKKRFLKSYTQTYLKEEVIIEQIIRKLPPFRRFLDIVGHSCTEIINYSNIAKDVSTDPKTIQRYFEILEDTLLGFFLPSYSKSIRKQQKKSKKFYLFDCGVIRTLTNQLDNKVIEKTYEYGILFENFIVNEINRLLNYKEVQFKLSFLRISETSEIDLIIELSNKTFVCEIKSTNNIDIRHASTLINFKNDFKDAEFILISNDKTKKQFENVSALFWKDAISHILS